MCSIERLFARMFVRLRCGVSCAMCGHVPLYAITATATATVCDHGRTCRAHVVSVRHVVTVAVITAALGVRRAWPWCRGFCVAVVWLRHADEC